MSIHTSFCSVEENSDQVFSFYESSPPSGDALSATNHEPTLFFSLLAPRLPHVVQGAKDTGDSGLKYMAIGKEKKAAEWYNCPMVPFLQTVHPVANDIAVELEHFVFV